MKFLLRPMRIEDAEALASLADDPEVWAHTQKPPAKTLEEWRGLIGLLSIQPWCFTACIDDEPIGAFSMIRQDGQYAHRAEIGGWLGKPFWGHGFATLAFSWLIDFGSRNGLQRIEARGAKDNPMVTRAGEKSGMALESVMKDGIVRGGRTIDELLYAWRKEAPCLG